MVSLHTQLVVMQSAIDPQGCLGSMSIPQVTSAVSQEPCSSLETETPAEIMRGRGGFQAQSKWARIGAPSTSQC